MTSGVQQWENKSRKSKTWPNWVFIMTNKILLQAQNTKICLNRSVIKGGKTEGQMLYTQVGCENKIPEETRLVLKKLKINLEHLEKSCKSSQLSGSIFCPLKRIKILENQKMILVDVKHNMKSKTLIFFILFSTFNVSMRKW